MPRIAPEVRWERFRVLIDAAWRCAATKRFSDLTVDDVCAAAGVLLTQIDPNDPDIVPEVARLRRECTEAKEALSVDTDTTIAVSLGGVRQRVRVTRAWPPCAPWNASRRRT